ncbi:MAG: ArnT family glycosyltransferase [Anaerolineae bacterium]
MACACARRTPFARISERWALAALLAIHVALGIYYSVTIPIWEAHDEIGHYYVARYIARERRLPPPGSTLVALNDETHQPPLYYLIAALPVSLVKEDTLQPHLNPHMAWPDGQGGLNRVVHDFEGERWPYRGTALAVHLARWVSVSLGALFIIGTYMAARELRPESLSLRWGAALMATFWPQFRFSTAVINNDILVAVCGALLTWLLVRVAMAERARSLDLLLSGGVLGAALLAKGNGLAFTVPFVAIVGYTVTMHTLRERSRLWLAIAAVATPILVVGWWYARNIFGGSGLFGGHRSLDALVDMVTTGLAAGSHRWILLPAALRHGWMSFFGAFGWNNVGLPLFTYVVAAGWTAVGALGFAAMCFCSEKARRLKRGLLAVILMALAPFAAPTAMLLLEGRSELQGRILLPMLPGLLCLLGLGWDHLMGRARRVGWALMSSAAALLVVAAPLVTILPAYASPPVPPPSQLLAFEPQRAFFGEFAELAGYTIDRWVEPQSHLNIRLLWRPMAQTAVDHTLCIQAFDRSRCLIGEVHRFPAQGRLATTRWSPGSMFVDSAIIPIDSPVAEPHMAWVEVSFYTTETRQPVPVADAMGNALGASLRLAAFKIRPTARQTVTEVGAEGHRFGPAIRLLHASSVVDVHGPRPSTTVHLQWFAAALPEKDYTISLQWRDEHNNLLQQVDEQPLGGANPTSFWEPGEGIADKHTLQSPSQLVPGVYRLWLCLYDGSSLQRLPVHDAQGTAQKNAELLLASLIVQRDGTVAVSGSYPSLEARRIDAAESSP